MYAVQQHEWHIAMILAKQKAELGKQAAKEVTALMLLMDAKDPPSEVVLALGDRLIPYEAKLSDSAGNTALMRAAMRGTLRWLKDLSPTRRECSRWRGRQL